MANSVPVVIASNQSAVPVSGTVTANAGTGNFTVVQPTGTNLHAVIDSGTIVVTQPTAANLNATVTNLTLTKGTQGATGVTVQALKDAGRNQTNLWMSIQLIAGATDTLMQLN